VRDGLILRRRKIRGRGMNAYGVFVLALDDADFFWGMLTDDREKE